MIDASVFARIEKRANRGKREVDRDTFSWPVRKRRKNFGDENHYGEYHLVISRYIKTTFNKGD